jgi:O-methyltransferase
MRDWTMLDTHARAFVAAGRSPILLAGSASDVELAFDELVRRQTPGTFLGYSEDRVPVRSGLSYIPSLSDASHVAAAILVETHLAPMIRYHGRCAPLQDRGVPVAVAGTRPIFTSPPPFFNQGDLTYAGMFHLAAQFARSVGVPGDYVEFGLFDGRTMTLAYHTLATTIPQLRIIGFDTFAGITGTMPEEAARFPDGSYYANRATFDHNMAVARVDPNRLIVVEGDMRETLQDGVALRARLGLTRCLVAHFDCDVYAAALAGLEFLTDVIDSGTLLLFDEYEQWGGDNNRGERRALREWLAAHPEFEVELYRRYTWGAAAFMVHRVG